MTGFLAELSLLKRGEKVNWMSPLQTRNVVLKVDRLSLFSLKLFQFHIIIAPLCTSQDEQQ